jgi:hypothetical protein
LRGGEGWTGREGHRLPLCPLSPQPSPLGLFCFCLLFLFLSLLATLGAATRLAQYAHPKAIESAVGSAYDDAE